MHVPAQPGTGSPLAGAAPSIPPVRLRGDAHIAITAPFFPDGDPLAQRHGCHLADGDNLDGEGALRWTELPLSTIMQGTLTFQQPSVDALTAFVANEAWLVDLRSRLNQLGAGSPEAAVIDRVELTGMLFPDGYGSVAATLRLPGGWEPAQRAATLEAIGVVGRELLAAELRGRLLPPLQRMLRRSGAGERATAVLPYFNLTYAGSTDHPEPGRATLDDELRPLVYPDSSLPLVSYSPWVDEFLYTGYAYHLLAMHDPVPNLQKLTLLLLVLNVSYARLARLAGAADAALRDNAYSTDLEWLAGTERWLRSEYQSLITPTFSFDHHALKVRDAVLDSWDVPKLQARADNLLSMVRGAVEFKLARDHTRRVSQLNWIVVLLTALSAIPAAEVIYSLFAG